MIKVKAGPICWLRLMNHGIFWYEFDWWKDVGI